MPYGGDPANDTSDELRLLIGDTAASPVLSDAEVSYYLSQSSNIYLAASYAVDGILAGEGGSVSEKQVGDLRIKYESGGGSGGLSGLAKSLRARAARGSSSLAYTGGISKADDDSIEDDSDRVSPAFKVGSMDNPYGETHDPAIVDWNQ